MSLFTTLLFLHITAGTLALLSGVGACLIKQYDWPHQWHKRFGQSFFYGMLMIFITAVPMSLIKFNLFLLLISIFSFYFAYSGWRYAVNRSGDAKKEDWCATILMIAACTAMLIYGIAILSNGDSDGITLIIFGALGIFNAVRNGYIFYSKQLDGQKRLALHVTMMLGGSIATVTAAVVTNFSMPPNYILWIAPTIVIVPYILYWNNKLLKKKATNDINNNSRNT